MNKGAKLNVNNMFKEIGKSAEIVSVRANACTYLHSDNIKGEVHPKLKFSMLFCALFQNCQFFGGGVRILKRIV